MILTLSEPPSSEMNVANYGSKKNIFAAELFSLLYFYNSFLL